MITVAADVAAKGKAKLPFLFLDHFWVSNTRCMQRKKSSQTPVYFHFPLELSAYPCPPQAKPAAEPLLSFLLCLAQFILIALFSFQVSVKYRL